MLCTVSVQADHRPCRRAVATNLDVAHFPALAATPQRGKIAFCDNPCELHPADHWACSTLADFGQEGCRVTRQLLSEYSRSGAGGRRPVRSSSARIGTSHRPRRCCRQSPQRSVNSGHIQSSTSAHPTPLPDNPSAGFSRFRQGQMMHTSVRGCTGVTISWWTTCLGSAVQGRGLGRPTGTLPQIQLAVGTALRMLR